MDGLGLFNRRITINEQTYTTNDIGEQIESWVELATVWAKIEYKGPTENEVMHKDTMRQKIYWTIRYRADIDAKMQIVYNGKDYDILGILEIDRNDLLEIQTELRE